jgi:hypothetical protein
VVRLFMPRREGDSRYECLPRPTNSPKKLIEDPVSEECFMGRLLGLAVSRSQPLALDRPNPEPSYPLVQEIQAGQRHLGLTIRGVYSAAGGLLA